MNRNSIIYPYWENIARAVEDICGLLFVVQTVAFAIATVLLILYVRILYKRRTWSVKTLVTKVSDAMYERKCKKG
jgi:membrane protein implicated in regulation of membrane protease activity